MQEVGEETDQKAKRRGDGAFRKTNFRKDQLEVRR